MRRHFFVGLCIIITLCAYSQSWSGGSRIWSPGDIEYLDLKTDQAKDLYMLGLFRDSISIDGLVYSQSNGARDLFLCKFSREGKPEWIEVIGSRSDEKSYGGLAVTDENMIFVAGGFTDTLFSEAADPVINTGSVDFFLAKFDSGGNRLWILNAGKGANIQTISSVCADMQGQILVSGQFRDTTTLSDQVISVENPDNVNCFYSKFAPSDGSLVWYKIFQETVDADGAVITDCKAAEDYYIFTGQFKDTVFHASDTLVSFGGTTDAFVMKTNRSGDMEWIEIIGGEITEKATTLAMDQDAMIYISGYYNSPFIRTDFSLPDSAYTLTNLGGFDLFTSKYDPSGNMQWLKTTGGSGDDFIFNSEYFDQRVILSGAFSDTLYWGEDTLATQGPSDKDLFMGYTDLTGNAEFIRTLSGNPNSDDQLMNTVHLNHDTIFSVIYSNAESLVLGEDQILSTGSSFHLTLGILSCLPFAIDNVQKSDIQTCFGDATGSINISASGGYGQPFLYSVNGENGFEEHSLFTGLAAGTYHVLVQDKEQCRTGPVSVQISEPDSMQLEIISTQPITKTDPGIIVAAVSGGTPPYVFTLKPDGPTQAIGTFILEPGEGGDYILEVTDQMDCGPVVSDTIEILDLSNSISDKYTDFAVPHIFPNPSTGLVTIEIIPCTDEIGIEVLNLQGQVLHHFYLHPSGGAIRKTVDLSYLPQGIYMFKLNGKTVHRKIIVNQP